MLLTPSVCFSIPTSSAPAPQTSYGTYKSNVVLTPTMQSQRILMESSEVVLSLRNVEG